MIDFGEMIDFWRTETVDIDHWIMPFDFGQHFLVPIEFEFWMQSALQQDLVAAKSHCFGNLFQQLRAVENVTLLMFGAAVKSAKIADRRADVGVIDVAVDVVGTKRLGMQSDRHLIGGSTERRKIVATGDRESFGWCQSFSHNGFVEQSGNFGFRDFHGASLGLVRWMGSATVNLAGGDANENKTGKR